MNIFANLLIKRLGGFFNDRKRKRGIFPVIGDVGASSNSNVVRGELENGAKLKTGEREIYVSQSSMNLYDDYL